MKVKICFVLEYYFPHIGGAETFFKNLVESLVKKGHDCFVVTSSVPGTDKIERINGVEVRRVCVPRLWSRYWFTILSVPSVYKIAKDCDILHTRTYNGAFPACLVSLLLKKPAVITIFEVLPDLWKTLPGMNWFNAKLHELSEKAAVGLPFDRYVCTSYYTRNQVRMLGIDDKKLAVAYPGIDQELFRYHGEDGRLVRERLGLKGNFVYMYFGRPGFFKGVDVLLKAVPMIAKTIPGSMLVLILSKEPRGVYKRLLSIIKDLKIEDSLILLDSMRIEELVKYISCCDCVVLPSLSEGFGFTCVEACSIGKPVVASEVGSIPEVIFGKHVFIRPRSPEEVCGGVQSVYLGNAAFQPRKTFDWQECAEKHEKIYAGLLERM